MRKKIRAARREFLKPLRDARKALKLKFKEQQKEAENALKTGKLAPLLADLKKKKAEVKEALKAIK